MIPIKIRRVECNSSIFCMRTKSDKFSSSFLLLLMKKWHLSIDLNRHLASITMDSSENRRFFSYCCWFALQNNKRCLHSIRWYFQQEIDNIICSGIGWANTVGGNYFVGWKFYDWIDNLILRIEPSFEPFFFLLISFGSTGP